MPHAGSTKLTSRCEKSHVEGITLITD